MYLTERFDAAPLAWENFIGMRHVVEQIPMAEISSVPPAPTIDSDPELSVRALFNDTIDESMPSKPVAEQRRYWGARGVDLTEGAMVERSREERARERRDRPGDLPLLSRRGVRERLG